MKTRVLFLVVTLCSLVGKADCSNNLAVEALRDGVKYNFSFCGEESMIRIYTAKESRAFSYSAPSVEEFRAIETECARGDLVATVRTNALNLSGSIPTTNPRGETVKVRACVYNREGEVVSERFEKALSLPSNNID